LIDRNSSKNLNFLFTVNSTAGLGACPEEPVGAYLEGHLPEELDHTGAALGEAFGSLEAAARAYRKLVAAARAYHKLVAVAGACRKLAAALVAASAATEDSKAVTASFVASK